MPPALIHPATPADVPAIAAMIRALADYEKLTHLCNATDQALDEALFGSRPAAEVLLATIEGEAAGFCLFFHTFSTFLARRGLWLEDLFVYPRFRGQGLGRALISHLAAIARERGCGRFEWAVLDWNRDAIDFYEKMGATLMPDWRLARVTGDALASFGTNGAGGPPRLTPEN